jgi:hypothetical protein
MNFKKIMLLRRLGLNHEILATMGITTAPLY